LASTAIVLSPGEAVTVACPERKDREKKTTTPSTARPARITSHFALLIAALIMPSLTNSYRYPPHRREPGAL
jgi:hypothetical protein